MNIVFPIITMFILTSVLLIIAVSITANTNQTVQCNTLEGYSLNYDNPHETLCELKDDQTHPTITGQTPSTYEPRNDNYNGPNNVNVLTGLCTACNDPRNVVLDKDNNTRFDKWNTNAKKQISIASNDSDTTWQAACTIVNEVDYTTENLRHEVYAGWSKVCMSVNEETMQNIQYFAIIIIVIAAMAILVLIRMFTN